MRLEFRACAVVAHHNLTQTSVVDDPYARNSTQAMRKFMYKVYEQPLLPHTSHELSHSITAHSPSSSPPLSPQSPAKYCVNLRIISPSNKKEYTEGSKGKAQLRDQHGSLNYGVQYTSTQCGPR